MKYDINFKFTNGMLRTLETFSTKLFDLLATKPFEEITINELCEQAKYPRATFYNYFDDKYDLLSYCFKTLTKKIGLDEYYHAENNQMLYLYFDRIYDFTLERKEIIQKILIHNNETTYMFSSFKIFSNNTMRNIFKNCTLINHNIPSVLLCDHYSNTLILVWQYTTLKNASTKDEAHKYLELLIGNL